MSANSSVNRRDPWRRSLTSRRSHFLHAPSAADSDRRTRVQRAGRRVSPVRDVL